MALAIYMTVGLMGRSLEVHIAAQLTRLTARDVEPVRDELLQVRRRAQRRWRSQCQWRSED